MPTALFNIPFLSPTTFSVAESNNHYRIIEALINPIVLGIFNAPPANSVEGFWYEVGTAPNGDFTGKTPGHIATKIADDWFFLNPGTVEHHFVSSTGQYYNPDGVIRPGTLYSTSFPAANSINTRTVYQAQYVIDANYPGCSIDLSSLPPFKGTLTVCNKGTNSLDILFFNTTTETVTANSVKVFVSDGINIYS